jgi:DNA-binding NarL/FixJ family response regulator
VANGPSRQVLLIPSRELGWAEVRKALMKLPEVARVHTASSLSEALDLADTITIDAVVLGPIADVRTDPNLVAEFRRRIGRDAPIVMIAPDFDVDLVLILGHLGITGYFLWADLTTDCLSRCLAPAVLDGMMVGSQTVGRAAIAAAQRRIPKTIDPAILKPAEETVLRLLGEGMTPQEIAAQQSVSERSVRRTISSLEEKLGAPTLFVLGMAFTRFPMAYPARQTDNTDDGTVLQLYLA